MNRKVARVAGYVALSLIWGSAWIGGEVVSGRVLPLRMGALRFSIGALSVALLAVVRRSPFPRARALRANLWLGVAIAALPYGLVVWASGRSSPVLPILLFAGLPIVAGLLAPWRKAAKAPRIALQGALIGVGGVALMLSNGLSFSPSDLPAMAGILIAVVSQAASLIHAKRLLRDAPALSSTALQLAVAAATLGLLSVVVEHGHASQWNIELVLVVIALGVAGSGTGFLLYYWLLGSMEPYQVATVQWMLPLVAIGEAGIASRELPPWIIFAGAVLTVGSAYVVVRADPGEDRAVTFQVTGGQSPEG